MVKACRQIYAAWGLFVRSVSSSKLAQEQKSLHFLSLNSKIAVLANFAPLLHIIDASSHGICEFLSICHGTDC